MFCYRCGAALAEDAGFCWKCGAKVNIERTREAEPDEKAAEKSLIAENVKLARTGDQAAIAHLYEQSYNAVFYSIRSVLKDEDAAMDVLQDAYIKAFSSLDQLSDDTSFVPWVKRIAINRAKDYLKKSKPVLFTELNAASEESDEPVEDRFRDENVRSMPEAVLDQQATVELIRQILDDLPDDQRAVIGMYYYDEMSVREIAETMGVTENTVKSRLMYGRKKVEKKVRELEKKGTKLYSFAPVTFLWFLFRNLDAQTVAAGAGDPRTLGTLLRMFSGAGAAEAVTKTVSAAGRAVSGQAAAQAAGTVTKKAAGKAAREAAKGAARSSTESVAESAAESAAEAAAESAAKKAAGKAVRAAAEVTAKKAAGSAAKTVAMRVAAGAVAATVAGGGTYEVVQHINTRQHAEIIGAENIDARYAELLEDVIDGTELMSDGTRAKRYSELVGSGKTPGYASLDINGDGVDELIVFPDSSKTGSGTMYYISEDEVKVVFGYGFHGYNENGEAQIGNGSWYAWNGSDWERSREKESGEKVEKIKDVTPLRK